MKIRNLSLMLLGIFIVVTFSSYAFYQISNGEMNELIDESLGIEKRGLLTGFAILNESSEVVNVSEEDALKAIEDSKRVIEEMRAKNFNVVFVEDLLLEAERVFEQAQFADTLRNSDNSEEKAQARRALRLVDWEDIYFSSVVDLTEEIRARKESALLLEDLIIVRKKEVGELKEASLTTRELVEEVDIAFGEERYNDTDQLLVLLRDSIESDKEGKSFVAGLRDGAKNFVQRYWWALLIGLVAIGFGSYYSNKALSKKFLKKKIAKMKQERNVLVHLIKKTQIDRYKKNVISGLVYNIRVKKYKEKLHRIDQELPVLRNRLSKMVKTKKKVKVGKSNKW